MSTLTLNSYVILFLFLFKTTFITSSEETECVIVDKTARTLCKGLDNIFKQDTGKLSQHVCGCGTAIITADYSYCNNDEYEFPDVPTCKELVHAKSFEETISRPNQLQNYLTNVLFKQIFNVCEEKNEEIIIKSVESIYQEGTIANGLEVVMQSALPSDLANLIIPCYRDLRKLANLSKN
uniref:Uncharacterized protein n=1 Tax=Strigamia maritima TaxID=126957 RepID=T1J8A2_STRMM